MRIAQVSPLMESVPPQLYGGTERIVSYLTESLVDLGHEVTLFASGDSRTKARLLSPCRRSLRLDLGVSDFLPHHYVMYELLKRKAHEFDLIHFHTETWHLPIVRELSVPSLTTMHGRLDQSGYMSLYREFSEHPLVSISFNQRQPLSLCRWAGNVYHGLPLQHLRPNYGEGSYLAFLGRVSPEKGLPTAIEIASHVGMPLKIAAKVDRHDSAYYESLIPILKQAHVEFVGEITDAEKSDFLGSAKALLFPIDWPEPFGLVMIEALAVGTPVIAFRKGSVPEVIDHGKTGFVVDSVAQACQAYRKINEISRRRCREVFEERFSAERMASGYLKIYQDLISQGISVFSDRASLSVRARSAQSPKTRSAPSDLLFCHPQEDHH